MQAKTGEPESPSCDSDDSDVVRVALQEEEHRRALSLLHLATATCCAGSTARECLRFHPSLVQASQRNASGLGFRV